MSESVHVYLLKFITKELKEEGDKISSQMGLWATPATWFAKYPHVPLNFVKSLHKLSVMPSLITLQIMDKHLLEFTVLKCTISS